MEGDIYDEEDFVAQTSGFELGIDQSDSELLSEVQEVEKSLALRIKVLKCET